MSDLGKMIAERMKSKGASSAAGDEEETDTDAADEAEPEESYDGVESDAADELASLVGLEGDDATSFKKALSQYVEACMNKSKPAPAAEEDEG